MPHILDFSEEAKRALGKLKKKDAILFERVMREIEKIIAYPEIGKPLRYVLKNHRRVRVGSFVLVYEIRNNLIRIKDFDHHDRVYEK